MMATKPTTPVRLVAMAFLTALLALGFALAAPMAAQAQSLDGATENLPVGEDSLPTDDVTGGGSGSGSGSGSLDLGGGSGSGSGSGSLDLGGGTGGLDLGGGGLDIGNLDLSGGNTDLVNNLQGVTDNLNLGDGGGDGRLQACLDALQNLVEVDSGVADLSARLQNLLEQCLGSEVGDVGGSGDLPVDGGSSDLGLGGNTDLTEDLNLGAGDGRLQACLDALQNLVEVDSGVDNLSDRVQNLLEQCLGSEVGDVGGSGDTGADADAGTDGDGGSDAGADADASAGADTEVDSSQVDVVPQGGVQTGGSAVPDNGSAAGVALAVFAGLTAVGTLSVRRRLGSAA
jgi:hypothetical protein